MNKIITHIASTIFLTGSVFMTGCSDGGGSSEPAAAPSNAVVITAENAEETVALAISTEVAFLSALGAETAQVTGLKATLKIVDEIRANHSNNSGADIASGLAFDNTELCTNGGSIKDVGDSNTNGTLASESGTTTFDNCKESGITLIGVINYDGTNDSATGAFTQSANGSLSTELSGNGISFITNLTSIDFQATGNNTTETSVVTKASFAIDIVIDGTSSSGFGAGLSADIVESSGGFDSCPESGTVVVNGANGTIAEGIYNGDGTMTITANGSVVTSSTTCYF